MYRVPGQGGQLSLEQSPSEEQKNVTQQCQLGSARDEAPFCKELPVSRVAAWREHVDEGATDKRGSWLRRGMQTHPVLPQF